MEHPVQLLFEGITLWNFEHNGAVCLFLQQLHNVTDLQEFN